MYYANPIAPMIINGELIKRVKCFNFLGMIISSNLGWENNTDAAMKKAQQRLYFLCQLKKFRLRREIFVQFYRSAIESILAFSTCVWFGGISQCQRSGLDRVVKTTSKIVGSELTSLTATSCIYNVRSKKQLAILSQTKLTSLIICLKYYHQATRLEILFTPMA